MGELKRGSWGVVPSTQAKKSEKWVGTLDMKIKNTKLGMAEFLDVYNLCSHVKGQKGTVVTIRGLRELVTVLVENTDARISGYFGSCCAYVVFIYFLSGEETGV
jgi:hypothetical protein